MVGDSPRIPAAPEHLRPASAAVLRHRYRRAAITGGLLGAAYGASTVPLRWRTLLRLADERPGTRQARSDRPEDRRTRPLRFTAGALVPPPYDDQGPYRWHRRRCANSRPVWMRGVAVRVATSDVGGHAAHVEVRLIRQSTRTRIHTSVFRQVFNSAQAVEDLRAQRPYRSAALRRAFSRTPTVAGAHGARHVVVGADEGVGRRSCGLARR